MTVKVRVVPRSKRQLIVSSDEGLKVYIREPALGGRANKKLLELLAQHYKIKKSSVSIVKGVKHRDKIVHIHETT